MRKWIFSALLLLAFFCTSCFNPFRNPFSSGGDDDDERQSALPARIIEPTAKFSLAIGGVAPGRDELVIYDSNGKVRGFDDQDLECKPDDEIVILKPRPGFATQAAGSGVQMTATDPGVTAIRCIVDGDELADIYEVTIPPQSLIQILVAEAGQQIADEAMLAESDEGDFVSLESESPTANALGSVIRNRIQRINSTDDPELFEADESNYDSSPPASYYDAVILAEGQFSPTDSSDPSHRNFDHAQDRNFLDDDLLNAYDQAVITAAGIFNGDISDITGGSFAFRSPTPEEWTLISQAWTMAYMQIPEGAGFSDATFPSLAPIQILIHPEVWKYSDGRPSFVFARKRTDMDFAVVSNP